jgi:hypothetical protein
MRTGRSTAVSIKAIRLRLGEDVEYDRRGKGHGGNGVKKATGYLRHGQGVTPLIRTFNSLFSVKC